MSGDRTADACPSGRLEIHRTALNPTLAVRTALARTGPPTAPKGLLALVGFPVVTAVWWVRLAWFAGSGGVASMGSAVAAWSAAPPGRSRTGALRALAAAAAVLAALGTGLVVVILATTAAVTALCGAGAGAAALEWQVLALTAGLLVLGLFCLARPFLPAARYDRLVTALAGHDGWWLRCLVATGPDPERSQQELLREVLELAGPDRPVLAGRVRTGGRETLEREMARRDLPGAPARWPPLLVRGTLPSSRQVAQQLPSVRRNWQVPLGFMLMTLPLAALVAAVVLREVLPAEKAAPGCADPAVTSCMRTAGDALYWAAATVTTTGYGDLYPHSSTGRGWAVVLMLTGVVVVSGLFVSLLVTALLRTGEREDRVLRYMRGEPDDELRERLQSLEATLAGLVDEVARDRGRPH